MSGDGATMVHFDVNDGRPVLLCSVCGMQLKQLKLDDRISVDRGYYCVGRQIDQGLAANCPHHEDAGIRR